MYKDYLRYILIFILLLLIQLLVLNNINLGGYINPYVYLLFILLLPYGTPRWVLLLVGFFTGLVVDYFSNTLGLHASATLILAFVRPSIMSGLRFSNNINERSMLNISLTGTEWFIRYAALGIVIHHSTLFMLETFSFRFFHLTLLRILLSSLVSFVFIFFLEVLLTRKK
ncbi:MAG TPA: rod shape-determining protein MreD [Tenuifilaceae bacterium]|jgi:rod shape-determining protein MreD|nr:rod shape-determining protein MreD [Bacteroidales bacterium]HNT41654.1 rod shape-determining protein MreD [Tenuifilaceae bacterium]NLI87336.1 rod shape-determining protein MreD [Bacteroidales bacterium]HNY08760.1 rod shape-determining protein MreD [Tenuifilaceae bacterium]HOA09478.1 rod shape-determining protein MreD [Tenuifilaceae bacterium]